MTSLLLAIDATSHIHLIVGSNPLAVARCAKSIEAGARPKVVVPEGAGIHFALQKKIEAGEVELIHRSFQDEDLFQLGRDEVDNVVDAVFVTLPPRDPLNTHISSICKRNRIPVNVSDSPSLCTFSLLSTHTDGPLQIGVTTNGKGCKLASRIRREIAASLPTNMGLACSRLGMIRRRIQQEDHLTQVVQAGDLEEDEQSSSFNKLVLEADMDAAKSRRIRWLSQICEYWPLKRLASITDDDVEAVLKSYADKVNASTPPLETKIAVHDQTQKGRIVLAGSGPGHPDLLTRATYKAIQSADVILADKLVPAGVLDLIPRRTPVHIARKFPGNAERAQEELLEMGLEGLKAGKTVLRLKQGDPYIYGRGGEEFDFFRRQGFGDRISVLPGITSALSASIFADIPATQRGVSDQVLICTGTGRKGAPTAPPEFVKTRTVVFLMALHRIEGLVKDLTTLEAASDAADDGEVASKKDNRTLWPLTTPCAVVERASCLDQRVIRTTLEFVVAAIEQEGSRPPGLLLLGAACEALHKREPGNKWIVEEGYKGLEGLEEMGELAEISNKSEM